MTQEPNPNEELKRAMRELRRCKRELKESQATNERLRYVVGGEELQGWTPKKRIERQYGWVFAWLYPLDSYLNQHMRQPLSADIRNRVHDICTAIIAQIAVSGKYGVKLPCDPRPDDMQSLLNGQSRAIDTRYAGCQICGEDRITHNCHIIPRSEGGPHSPANFVTLCPLHHHLFDHNRLTLDEWTDLMDVIETKMEAAIVYAREVRLPQLRLLWKEDRLEAGQLVKCAKCDHWVGATDPYHLTSKDVLFCEQCARGADLAVKYLDSDEGDDVP